MGLVIEGIFTLALILLVLWLLSLRSSVTKDQTEARAAEKREQEDRERAAREARLYRKGEKLRCLGCDYSFVGPMPETGCPECHLSALVVTERDYQQGRQASQRAGRKEP